MLCNDVTERNCTVSLLWNWFLLMHMHAYEPKGYIYCLWRDEKLVRRTAQWHLRFGVDTDSICVVAWLAKLEDNVIEVLEIYNKFHYLDRFWLYFRLSRFSDTFLSTTFLFNVFYLFRKNAFLTFFYYWSQRFLHLWYILYHWYTIMWLILVWFITLGL